MFVFFHDILLKVPTALIWSLKPCGLAVPSFLIQNSFLGLRNEVSRVGFQNCGKPSQRFALSCHPQNDLVDGSVCGVIFVLLFKWLIYDHLF